MGSELNVRFVGVEAVHSNYPSGSGNLSFTAASDDPEK